MNQEELRDQLLQIIDSVLNARSIVKHTNLVNIGVKSYFSVMYADFHQANRQ